MRAALDALSRAALGAVFVRAGVDVVRTPAPPAKKAQPVLAAMRSAMPAQLPDDETIVRANAAAQIVGGLALVAGIAPRLAAGALVASLVPTTAGGHRFWEFEDAERTNQRNHFFKNVAIVGGLLHVASTPRRHRTGKDEP